MRIPKFKSEADCPASSGPRAASKARRRAAQGAGRPLAAGNAQHAGQLAAGQGEAQHAGRTGAQPGQRTMTLWSENGKLYRFRISDDEIENRWSCGGQRAYRWPGADRDLHRSWSGPPRIKARPQHESAGRQGVAMGRKCRAVVLVSGNAVFDTALAFF
jgi:hypothetical protein